MAVTADPFGLGAELERARPPPPRQLVGAQRIMGIDPGTYGAFGMVEFPGWRLLDCGDLPMNEELGRRATDVLALAELLRAMAPTLVVIERVQPVPEDRGKRQGKGDLAPASVQTAHGEDPAKKRHNMGTVGAFNYGWVCAQVYATVRLCGHVPVMVHPGTWKAAAEIRGKGLSYAGRKALSLSRARQMWPDAPLELAKHDGRAEALLLARFGLSSQMRFF